MQLSGDDGSRKIVSANKLATAAQLLTFATAFLAVFAPVIVSAISGGAALALYVWSLDRRRRENRGAKSEVDRLAAAVDIDHVLRELAQSLGVGRSAVGWRVSLYRLEIDSQGLADGGVWGLEARAASQRAFEISRDSLRFAANRGVLRTAIASADSRLGGIDMMPSLPDPDADPKGWIKVMTAWGFDVEDAWTGPKSRSYCGRAFRVGFNRGKGADMTLGLVVESSNPSAIDRQAMEDVLTRPVFELLYELLRLREEMKRSLSQFSTKLV